MAKKISFALTVLIFIVIISVQTCSAADIQRVAILPVSFSHSYVDKDVESVIVKALNGKFHTPLANIVTIFEIIPGTEIQSATEAEVGTKKIKEFKLDRPLLKNIAMKTNADIVIGAEVTEFWTFQTITWRGDTIRETNLGIKIMIYHRQTEKYTVQKDADYYLGDEGLWGQPDYMADQMMFKLLAKIPDYSGLTKQPHNN